MREQQQQEITRVKITLRESQNLTLAANVQALH